MCGISIKSDLETMLRAAGCIVNKVPKNHRASIRQLMLKAFNLLHAPERDEGKLSEVITEFSKKFEINGKTLFLSLFVRVSNRDIYSGLIKSFHGFILRPEYGVLTTAVEQIWHQAQELADQPSALSVDAAEKDLDSDNTFELVRGEDEIRPHRS